MENENYPMTEQEVSIFGQITKAEVEQVMSNFEAEQVRLKKIGEAMDLIIESLPNWVSYSQMFDLILMSETERTQWLSDNAPKPAGVRFKDSKEIIETVSSSEYLADEAVVIAKETGRETEIYFQKTLTPGKPVQVGSIRI